MKLTVPVFMSVNAGYVDTAGFLALQGLFTAHVTGNFVTLGASLVLGTAGAAAKLAALPVFCAVIVATRMFSVVLPRFGLPILRTMLWLELALLAVGAALAVELGPFRPTSELPMFATGMALVAAMAIQNAASRIHLGTDPPTTLMTGTTTQIMIDIADLLRGLPPDARLAARTRMAKMSASVLAFAIGCAAGALLFGLAGTWCFVLPPLLALVPVLMPGSSDAK
jgi:uncharacterized membrane protein YoaK (UPF0700 family)